MTANVRHADISSHRWFEHRRTATRPVAFSHPAICSGESCRMSCRSTSSVRRGRLSSLLRNAFATARRERAVKPSSCAIERICAETITLARLTPADPVRFESKRHYATLVALTIEGTATVTDETIDLHDRIIGKLFNAARHKHERQFQASGRVFVPTRRDSRPLF